MLRLHIAPLSCCVALTFLSACAGNATTPSGSPAAPVADKKPLAAGPLTVTPAEISFTTVRKLTMKVSEKDYSGKFSIASQETSVATVSPKSGTGPGPIDITVTAGNAGSTKIIVKDDHGGSVTVPVSVTTGVIVVQ
jgi:hypothetical protein